MKKTTLGIERILQILPQRPPMVMVDRVSDLVAGDRIVAHKTFSVNEPWLSGGTAVPGVFVLEALAQAATILAYATDPFDAKRSLLYFLGYEKVKLRRPVVATDAVELVVSALHHRTNVWKFAGEALVDGTLCAQAELLASVVDRSG